jgi:hypothetical protein
MRSFACEKFFEKFVTKNGPEVTMLIEAKWKGRAGSF